MSLVALIVFIVGIVAVVIFNLVIWFKFRNKGKKMKGSPSLAKENPKSIIEHIDRSTLVLIRSFGSLSAFLIALFLLAIYRIDALHAALTNLNINLNGTLNTNFTKMIELLTKIETLLR